MSERCMVVVNEQTGETCGKPAAESARLPLDPHGDDEAGRERRMVDVRLCQEHYDVRYDGQQWWFRAMDDRHGRAVTREGPGDSSDVEFGDSRLMRKELAKLTPDQAAGETCEVVVGLPHVFCGQPAVYVRMDALAEPNVWAENEWEPTYYCADCPLPVEWRYRIVHDDGHVTEGTALAITRAEALELVETDHRDAMPGTLTWLD